MPNDPFDAIADPHRRHVLEELRRRPRTVTELADGLPISRPAVSQHMKVLLDAGLVTARAQGTRRIYSVNDEAFLPLNLWLDQFWASQPVQPR
ncbi:MULTISPECIES: metalloregulator ArsR/SmtB family transcription factor [unclassified Roseitalea]|uniref:ArsR/SmtB family transcription factor n=1 Tax=unclassified Roseitalea TaxID=2639107 RepID=UPI00273EC99A|nr:MULTISPECIES: metalloregulator ArsR/SmtB family transcription factor [unclassified Roseitalea]